MQAIVGVRRKFYSVSPICLYITVIDAISLLGTHQSLWWPTNGQSCSSSRDSRELAMAPQKDDQVKVLPPSGLIAGIYTRTDGRRGVRKSTANARLVDVKEIAYATTEPENEVLSGMGVDCLRSIHDIG